MQHDRIRALSSDIYNCTFQVLDSEPDESGEFAGFVAEAVQRAFEYACMRTEARDTLQSALRDELEKAT